MREVAAAQGFRAPRPSTSDGTPSLKVAHKFLLRINDADTLVLRCALEEKEGLGGKTSIEVTSMRRASGPANAILDARANALAAFYLLQGELRRASFGGARNRAFFRFCFRYPLLRRPAAMPLMLR